jgi:hypothetical protein
MGVIEFIELSTQNGQALDHFGLTNAVFPMRSFRNGLSAMVSPKWFVLTGLSYMVCPNWSVRNGPTNLSRTIT